MGTAGNADPTSSSEPGVDAVRAHLQRILKSSVFFQSVRLSRFLSYGVEAALSGKTGVNEYAIGIDVFEKKPNFDPRIDPTVRVQARRLRSKLRQYYEHEGSSDSIEISLPLRAYVPIFRMRAPRLPAKQKYSAFQSDPGARDAILVLPFMSLNPNPEDDYFAAGLTQEVINALSKSTGWRIVAWSEGRARPDFHAIAKEVEVQAVLDGTVRRASGKFRISIGLMSFPDRTVLWSRMYEAEIDSILPGQERIAQDIFQQLRLRAESQSGTTKTFSEEAHKEYLKGRYWFRTCSYDGLQKCKHHLMQSLAEDPQNPATHAALAEAFVALALYGDDPPPDRMADAQREAEHALDYGTSAYGQVAIGLIAGFQEWNWAAAESAFLRAIEMNPTLSCAHQWYASACLAPAGRLHEAAAELKRALEPDPLSILIANQFAHVLTAAGQIDFALKQLGECLDLDRNVALTHWTLGLAFTGAERISQAIQAFERATELSAGASYAHASLAYARAVAGQSAEATRILEQIEQRSKYRYVPPIDLGLVHLGLGNYSEAFDYFEQARERRCSRLIWMNIDPRMQHLRGDPRFEKLLQALGLDPSLR